MLTIRDSWSDHFSFCRNTAENNSFSPLSHLIVPILKLLISKTSLSLAYLRLSIYNYNFLWLLTSRISLDFIYPFELLFLVCVKVWIFFVTFDLSYRNNQEKKEFELKNHYYVHIIIKMVKCELILFFFFFFCWTKNCSEIFSSFWKLFPLSRQSNPNK